MAVLNPLRRLAVCAALTAVLGIAQLPASALADPLPPLPAGDPWWPGDRAPALPLPAFGELLVDNAHQVLYVSGGRTANSVLVLGFDGRVRATVDHEYGATGMALSADGKTLYVAEAAGDAVSAVDTGTLTERARYAAPVPGTCPTSLARTGDRVWVGYGCGTSWDGGIAELDTAAAQPQLVLGKQDQSGDTHYSAAPRLAAGTTADQSTLAVSEPALSPVTLSGYRVDGDRLRLLAAAPRGGSNLNDLALSPDGATAFLAAGSQHQVDAFATADLSSAGAYATGSSPAAVALNSDGTQLATATGAPGGQVLLHPVGRSTTTTVGRLPDDETAAAHGLAFSADGGTLFLVTTRAQDPAPRLRILSTRPADPGAGAW